jgi:DNA-binding transcriptional LysR family regulator
LQAFVSAAHHLNFSRAAEELCVTAAAVSHQIRLLESHLNTPLFERQARGLLLTPAALSLQSVCDRAFAEIGDVIDAIGPEGNRVIRLSSLPHFSGKMLLPALSRFKALYPRYSLEVSHTLTVPDFSHGKQDFAILFGSGEWPGLESELLFTSPTGPTCAPSLLEAGRIAAPADLAAFPILLDHSCFQVLWVDWFKKMHADGWEKLSFVPCNDIHALLGAVQQGFGFIMEPEFMIGDLVRNGSLVYPFHGKLTNYGYYLVYPHQSVHNSGGRAFREWLRSELPN